MLLFEASAGTRFGARMLLGFWAVFAAFWGYECATGARGGLVYAWTVVAVAGLVLQWLRVRSLRQALLLLDERKLEALDLLGRPVRMELDRVLDASIRQRRRRVTLVLRFARDGAPQGRWFFSLDELQAPQDFAAQLLARIPQACVDGSVQRYARSDTAAARDTGPRER